MDSLDSFSRASCGDDFAEATGERRSELPKTS